MKKLLLLLFLLIIPFAAAQVEPIYNSRWLDLSLTLNSFITLIPESPSYSISEVTANLSFIPLETWRQDVQSIETSPNAELYDNSAVFTWKNPQETNLNFALQSNIRTLNDFYKIKTKIRFPLENLPEELDIYLKPSEKVDSNHPLIIQKANELAAGEDDLFMVVHKLAEYTHQQINYNLSTVNAKATLSASYVLLTKEGVCDEISVLFMAMARALGIPARFVSGISYTNSELFAEKWGPHGWAEVYFPGYGWVPFDVTYDELGFIDASHITSKISDNPEESSLHYQWRGRNIDLKTSELKSSVEITNYGPKLEDQVELVILPLKSNVGFGSYNLIEVQVENLKEYYVTTTVYLSRTTDMTAIEHYARPVLLKPGQRKRIFWTITINPSLDPNYIYTFPVQASTIRNTTVETKFSSKRGDPVFDYNEIKTIMLSRQREEEKEVSRDIILSCDTDKDEYFSGDESTISCEVENKGNFPVEALNVCHRESCRTLDIGISAKKSFDFVVGTTGYGRAEALITATNKDIAKTATVAFDVLDDPLIKVTDKYYPETIEYGNPFEIEFLLKKLSFSDPQNVEIILMQNGLPQMWEVDEMTKDRKIVVEFEGTELSMDNKFDILVNYQDKKGENFIASSSFEIELVNVGFGNRIVIFFKDILRSIERVFS